MYVGTSIIDSLISDLLGFSLMDGSKDVVIEDVRTEIWPGVSGSPDIGAAPR